MATIWLCIVEVIVPEERARPVLFSARGEGEVFAEENGPEGRARGVGAVGTAVVGELGGYGEAWGC